MTEETLFAAALEQPPADRDRFLVEACGANTALLARLRALLTAHGKDAGILDQPAEPAEAAHEPPVTPPAWEAVATLVAGRYKLLEQIGEGGMGTVWVAEQTQPVRRRVALKLVKAGMDSKTVLSRFEAERQALALMDHPNIAKVLDGGTTESGRPFFVMEYVKGVPITKYCDDARLSIAERLALFVPVCQAVQHAHQKGIIHRDLKPSNILVCLYDSRPIPKVIDFGLAKAMHQPLTEHTLYTAHGLIIGTPLYMSPEQAELNNFDVDTRTDIYSLGVILYELLTGTTPLEKKRFKEAAWQEMLRLIKEEEPPMPSARLSSSGSLPSIAAQRKLEPAKLTRLVRGELDWIVMKALDKDRGRRYETANGFARDIQRHLADEAVEACPPSARYRLRKFARRHRAGIIMAVTIVVLLLAGVAGSCWQAVRATLAEDEAKAQEAVAHEQKAEAQKQATIARENENKATKTSQEKDVALKELTYNLAIDRIVLAQAAFNSHNGRDLLKQVPPELRKWEWQYLQRQYHGGIFTLYGHIAPVECVAFNSDGTRLVTGSWEKTAKVWDARTGTFLFELKGHSYPVHSAAFSPDGTRVVTGSGDMTAKVWDAHTGTFLYELKGHRGPVIAVGFSADGTRLVTGSLDKTAKFWDVPSGTHLSDLPLSGYAGALHGLAFSPDGTRIVAASWDKTARIWDAGSGVPLLDLNGHMSGVYSVAFSPDGTRVATGSNDHTAKVWDARTGALLFDLQGHRGHIKTVAFSPDGARLVTGSWDQTAKVWDARTGRHLLDLQGQGTEVICVAFSPDGARVVTGNTNATVKMWDARTGSPVLELKGHTAVVERAAFSPDGTRLITGSADRTATVWDARTGAALLSLKGHIGPVRAVAFSPDGTRLATGDHDAIFRGWPGTTRLVTKNTNHNAKVWDALTGTHLVDLKGHTGGVLSIAFSPDGKRLVTGSWDTTAKVWDAHTGMHLISLKGHNAPVWCVAFSPDGKLLATGSQDMTAKIWDAGTGTHLRDLTGHTAPVSGVAFFPNGEDLITGSWDKTAKAWNADTGTLLREFRGHAGWLVSVALSPDGTRLVTGDADRTAKVWDAHTGIPLLDLKGHSDQVTDAAFSPDGTRVVTASYDKTAKIWDTRIGMPPLKLNVDPSNLFGVAFSLDGTRVITTHRDKSAKVWDVRTGRELQVNLKNDQVVPRRTSPDGRYFAHVDEDGVWIVSTLLSPDEREYRLFWTQPRPDFHREEYLKALRAKDVFAARFHVNRISLRDAQLHIDAGSVLRETHELEGAIAEYRQAIELDPKLIVARQMLATVLAERKDWDGTLAVFRDILALSKKNTTLAHYLGGRGRPYFAARLFAVAFDQDSKLADDVTGGHRYDAACCAALTARGQGEDTVGLDETERARWCKKALDWLRADLAVHEKQLAAATPGIRTFVQQRLQHWQRDNDLFGLRDSIAITKLPAQQQQECMRLWADVAKLLRKAREPMD